ncbi:MAG: 16S rRNA (adenine(1518)-N(6)/adenine(1519)-N(6))-dimethyltransferase RsmA [Clostridiales bacterium]|nr:16S rRNA (adenine(1518)-N(6)/adenine(1519)-N(6))-dimethyltransferase RsmA [Clostridiales bacterium]
MNSLSDIGVIRDILGRHGFRFSKSLGQNFLINPTVCPRMALESGVDDETGVIEIGPGIGVLTSELAKRAKKVVCIELDSRLMPVLNETLSDFDNIKVINADVLKVDLRKIIEEHFGSLKVAVCANLPYYITSPVIMHLLESRLPVESITVMVQREAALRLTAQVGSRQAGAVTAAVNYYSQASLLFNVSRGSFMPAPNVDSAVIRLDIRNKPPVEVHDEKEFFRFIRASFGQRRKTAANALSSGLSLPKEAVTAALREAGMSENTRAESLQMNQLALLFECLTKQCK